MKSTVLKTTEKITKNDKKTVNITSTKKKSSLGKILARVFAIIALVIVILAAAGSVYMGKFVSDQIRYQNKNNDTKANSIKELEKWGYDLNGFYENYGHGEDFTVTAEDGNTVPGTIFTANSDKWVILVHGAGGDRVAVTPVAELFLEKGYNVITYDQRGHGDNEDQAVTFGINEVRDVKALVSFARTQRAASEVIVLGQSMGGQTTALYASSVTPGDIDAADAVICDSPVPGMELFLRLMFSDDHKTDLYNPFSNYLIATSKAWLYLVEDVDMKDGDTIARVADIRIPTMIIISDQDEVCYPELVQKVYDNVGTADKAVMHVDSQHIRGAFDHPTKYIEGVTSFLSQYGL